MIYTQLRAIYTKYKRGREKVNWTESYKHWFPELNWSILVHNLAAQNIYIAIQLILVILVECGDIKGQIPVNGHQW